MRTREKWANILEITLSKEGLMDNVYYGDYLHLDKLLSSQKTKSAEKYGKDKEAHDETLFIIVHQAYELWFKQIIHEMHSIYSIFEKEQISEKELSTVVHRLSRIIKIQELLLSQLKVMETMTPLDFLEFRDLLMPASGFQSVQFREIEILMGLRTNNRFAVDREYFLGRLDKKDRAKLEEIEKKPSLLSLIENWLSRTPFLDKEKFVFWDEYRKSVQDMLYTDKESIKNNPGLSDAQKDIQVENLLSTIRTFQSLFIESDYEELLKAGKRKINQKAMLGALFISLYRDEPILYLPFRVITCLVEIDQGFTSWRYNHHLMAHRMLGTKIGTGGTSGHHYLKLAAENNRVFTDFFDIATFLIPKSKLPKLPAQLKKELNFYLESRE